MHRQGEKEKGFLDGSCKEEKAMHPIMVVGGKAYIIDLR